MVSFRGFGVLVVLIPDVSASLRYARSPTSQILDVGNLSETANAGCASTFPRAFS